MWKTAQAALRELGGRSYAVAGHVPPAPRLAVVGSRAANLRLFGAIELAVGVARSRGYAVVSGGARGVDVAAHRAALTQGVPQLAVLPCGPDRSYPPEHARVFAAIARGLGGVLFAHAAGTAPSRGMFASRNRLVVDLCDAVLVIEASARSGTMVTGRLALARGRPLAALTASAGGAALVARGATALRFSPEQPEAFVRSIGGWLAGEPAVASPAWPGDLAWLKVRLHTAGSEGASVDELGAPLAVAVAVAYAETLGLVREVSPGRYVALD